MTEPPAASVTSPRAPPRWLELTLDYRCNLRCLGCRACEDTGETMAGPEISRWLSWGRARGMDSLWIGGGEPTLRDDLTRIVKAARKLGYREVLVQTNAMRLSYPTYADALLEAGVTLFSVNVKSHRAEVHDRLSRHEGCHALLERALEVLAERRARVAADVLLARSSVADLPALVPYYASRGVTRFWLWLLSASDAPDAEVSGEIPRITDAVPFFAAARDAALAAGVELRSLHTPACTLPPEIRDLAWSASSLGLVVVNPGQAPIGLEASPMEGGAYVPACEACGLRPSCPGPRADYLALHGGAELVAVR